MILGIDATNISAGGGITHLEKIVGCYITYKGEIKQIIIWSSSKTLSMLPDIPILKKKSTRMLDGSLIQRTLWRTLCFDKELKREKCDILWAPGGTYTGSFKPFVSMSRNMLIWEEEENARKSKKQQLKLWLLRMIQTRSFKKADGIIFISNYAQSYITGKLPFIKNKKATVIYHGATLEFKQEPKKQKKITLYSEDNPFVILYVSHIGYNKHQWNVVEAVGAIVQQGYHVKLLLVGNPQKGAYEKLMECINTYDKYMKYVEYAGFVPHKNLKSIYAGADAFLFASTCENMPNTVVEAMVAGLPILSSHYGPMPEVLGDAALYFDPVNVTTIKKALKVILDSPETRKRLAEKAFNNAMQFSWEKCATQTISFIKSISGRNAEQ